LSHEPSALMKRALERSKLKIPDVVQSPFCLTDRASAARARAVAAGWGAFLPELPEEKKEEAKPPPEQKPAPVQEPQTTPQSEARPSVRPVPIIRISEPPPAPPAAKPPAVEPAAPAANLREARRERLNAELRKAAYSGKTKEAERLIARGADVNAKANNGWTALDVAVANKHTETAEMLRKRMGLGVQSPIEARPSMVRAALVMATPKPEFRAPPPPQKREPLQPPAAPQPPVAKIIAVKAPEMETPQDEAATLEVETDIMIRPEDIHALPPSIPPKPALKGVDDEQETDIMIRPEDMLPLDTPAGDKKPPVSVPGKMRTYKQAVAAFVKRFGIGARKEAQPDRQPLVEKPKPPAQPAPSSTLEPQVISGIVLPLPNIASRPDLEQLLEQWHPRYDQTGTEIEKNMLIRRVARTIVSYWSVTSTNGGRKAADAVAIHPFYHEAVRELRQGYSNEWVVALASGLVNRHYRPKTAPAPEARKDVVDIVKSLSAHERSLVCAALKHDSCDIVALQSMHAGVRELRIRNYISSMWAEPDWLSSLEKLNAAKKSLHSKLGLSEPTGQERWAAVTDPKELSDFQRKVIAASMKTGMESLTQKGIAKFAGGALKPANQRNAMNLWSNERADLVTFGHLAYKLRYSQKNYTQEEAALLHSVLEKDERPSPKSEDALRKALITKTIDKDEVHWYRPEVMKLYKAWPSMRFDSLQVSARMQDEWNTAMEFMGLPVQRPNVLVVKANTLVRPKKTQEGKYVETSEDCAISLVIGTEDGPILLDAIFDGMGGHNYGARASSLARSVLAISAFAGWIRSAEDVSRALITADLAITMEQIADKDKQEDDDGEKKKGADSDKRTNNMGSTAIVALQKKDLLYIVHCGDSEGRVIRDGKAIFKTQSHDMRYQFWQEAVASDNPQFKECFGPDGSVISPDLKEMFRNRRHVITSGLGASLNYLSINNSHTSHEGIQLMPGDVIALDSDGINEPVCADHEYALLIREAGGNLGRAREKIMALAELRQQDAPYSPRCAELGVKCEKRDGKNDDKSIMLRYAGDGSKKG